MAIRHKSATLSVVADNAQIPELAVALESGPDPVVEESLSQKVRHLQAEARCLAKQHIGTLRQALADVETLAMEIAEGGDVYAGPIREIARRFAADAEVRIQALDGLTQRN